MRKNFLVVLLISAYALCYGQTGLKFNDVFNASITGEKMGIIDVIQKKTFTVDSGTVVKITTSSISEISTFDGSPSVLTASNQGVLFINDFPVTNIPEANVPTVTFPIWLKEGRYELKLVSRTNSTGKKLRGLINGLIYSIE